MAAKKTNRKKKPAKAKSKPAARKTVRGKNARGGRNATTNPGPRARIHQGVGLKKTGRSQDTEGLSAVEDVDNESVAELEDEGQSFEAEIVDGIERAGNANQGEVTTEEVPEDDVPSEYRDYRENEE
jgi:hypothetical protein